MKIRGEEDERTLAYTIEGHHRGNPVRKLDFTPENWLVTASKTIKIFDLEKKKRVRKLVGGKCKVYSLLVVDNYLLATGDDDGCFRLYDYRTHPDAPVMEIKPCEDYISDLDVDVGNRMVVATSGEGTLTAFNIRARKIDQTQSELFDSAFNCVRILDTRGKVIVGAGGVINIFNWKEWGNISDRFPIKKTTNIESIALLDPTHILFGDGDGRTRVASILPNEVLSTVFVHRSPVECVRVDLENQIAVSCAGNEIKRASFSPIESDDDDDDEGNDDSSSSDSNDDEGKGKKNKKKKKSKNNKKNKKKKNVNDFFKDLM